MDSEFLEYYNRELNYIREAGREFAKHYPKIASRLGMQGIEVSDPFVERLLEGFSFLTARIQMKMDAEFPQFTQSLLEVMHPNYVSPTPSMGIIKLIPDEKKFNMSRGFEIPKGTLIEATIQGSKPCHFSIAQAFKMWPIELVEASVMGVPGDLPLRRMGFNTARNRPQVQSALRLRFAIVGGQNLHSLKQLDQLMFYLNGQDSVVLPLLELMLQHTVGIVCHDHERPMRWMNRLTPDAIRHEGFDAEQAMLPTDPRVFQGYRILHEYFAFPQRFLFLSFNQLIKGLQLPSELNEKANAERLKSFEITVLFDQPAYDLEGNVSAEHMALNCAPIINLFPKRGHRVLLKPDLHEYHVVPDKVTPLDWEVYSVVEVKAQRRGTAQSQTFKPLFLSLGADSDDPTGYFAVRREPRKLSDVAERHGPRTSYLGSEVFISLVDPNHPPYRQDLESFTPDLLCTNRDLPLALRPGDGEGFKYDELLPISGVEIVRGPTKPRSAIAKNAYAWRLLSHLNLSYMSLMDLDEAQGAEVVREILRLYGNVSDSATHKQIDAIRKVSLAPMHQRIPMPGPILYGRGVRITVEVDDLGFSGLSPYLLGAVLNQFFARHVAINLMMELVMVSSQRGEIGRWRPTMGGRPVV